MPSYDAPAHTPAACPAPARPPPCVQASGEAPSLSPHPGPPCPPGPRSPPARGGRGVGWLWWGWGLGCKGAEHPCSNPGSAVFTTSAVGWDASVPPSHRGWMSIGCGSPRGGGGEVEHRSLRHGGLLTSSLFRAGVDGTPLPCSHGRSGRCVRHRGFLCLRPSLCVLGCGTDLCLRCWFTGRCGAP